MSNKIRVTRNFFSSEYIFQKNATSNCPPLFYDYRQFNIRGQTKSDHESIVTDPRLLVSEHTHSKKTNHYPSSLLIWPSQTETYFELTIISSRTRKSRLCSCICHSPSSFESPVNTPYYPAVHPESIGSLIQLFAPIAPYAKNSTFWNPCLYNRTLSDGILRN